MVIVVGKLSAVKWVEEESSSRSVELPFKASQPSSYCGSGKCLLHEGSAGRRGAM